MGESTTADTQCDDIHAEWIMVAALAKQKTIFDN
jgi:hypothetical protein